VPGRKKQDEKEEQRRIKAELRAADRKTIEA
jgi:hypothetical protein